MDDAFMLASEFILGAKVRAGKGYTCLEEGSEHVVEADSGGNLCLRCRFKWQSRNGYHYPLDGRSRRDDDRLNELYLVASPVQS